MELDLLLVHADDGRPTLGESLPGRAAFSGAKPDLTQRQVLRDRGGNLDDLRVQRWAVAYPDTPLGERLLDIIEPLRRLRREEQGGVPVQTYRIRPGMSTAQAIDWRKKVYEDSSVDEDLWPYYLLILGDFDDISLAFQEVMAAECIVGRIAFAGDDGYASYVAKVLRWHARPYPDTGARALLFTVNDGTAATTMGYRSLMEPSLSQFRRRAENGILKVKEIVELDGDLSSAADLLEQLGRPEPTVLFSMSHGLGAPRRGFKSYAEQRAIQGAMSLGEGESLRGGDIATGAFLPGGVWFYLACYGAGTPSKSAYHEWLRRLHANNEYSGRLDAVLAGLPKAGDKPFVAALPQAALANPDGPLAVMSHVDLAWTYAFQDPGAKTIPRASRFQGIFRQLLAGQRVGVAYKELVHSGVQTAVDLSTKYGEDEQALGAAAGTQRDSATLIERANLWMLRHDLLGYVLLGDPAARVPFSAEAPRAAVAPSLAADGQAAASPKRNLAATFGFAVKAAGRGGEAADPVKMDQAVSEALGRASPLAEIAARYNTSVANLERWIKVYTEAGKEALKRLC